MSKKVVSLRNIYITSNIKNKSILIMLQKNDKMTDKIAMQLIGGISHATASRYIITAKEYFQKKPHQVLTVEEFCLYYGIKYE